MSDSFLPRATPTHQVQYQGRTLRHFIWTTSGLLLLAGLHRSVTGRAVDATLLLFVAALLVPLPVLILQKRAGLQTIVHLYFISINLALLAATLLDPVNAGPLPLLLLASVAGTALFLSLRSSLVYFLLFVGGLTLLLAPLVSTVEWSNFVVTATVVALVIWLFSFNLQRYVSRSREIAERLERQTREQERRVGQFRLSAEVGQVASASLDLEHLMAETVNLIRDQFGFYHAAIFLMDENSAHAVVREATGPVGTKMKQNQHRLAVGSDSVIGWVTANRQARIVADVGQEQYYFANPLLPKTLSEAALPLLARGELLGALDVQSQEPNAFQEEDITILQVMANQVASAIDNARLFASTQARLEETEILLGVSQLLASTLDVLEIYRRAGRAFVDEFNASRALIYSWEEGDGTLITRAAFVRENGEVVEDRAGEHLTVSPAELPYLNETITSREMQRVATDEGAIIVLPLIASGRLLGLAEVNQSTGRAQFTPVEIDLARTTANLVATALSNANMASAAHARAAQMSTINRVTRALSLAPNLPEIFATIRQEVFALTEATGISITLLSADKGHLEWVYAYEFGGELDVKGTVFPLDQGLSGYVARTREPLLIDENFSERLEEFASFTVGHVSSAWLGVPLIVANELIGVLSIESGYDPQAFMDSDVQLLTTVSGPVATAIANLVQLETIRSSQASTALRYEISRDINAAQNNHQVLQALMRLPILQKAERVTLNLFSGDSDATDLTMIGVAAIWPGDSESSLLGELVPFNQLPYAQLLSRDEAVIVNDLEADARVNNSAIAALGGDESLRAFATFPLIAGNVWIGFVAAFGREPDTFATLDSASVMSLVGQAATTVQNQRLLERTQEALLAQSQQSLQLQTAAAVSAVTNSILDVEELMQHAVTLIQERFGLYYVGLLLLDEEGEWAVLRAGTGQSGRSQVAEGFRLQVGGNSLVGGVTADGKARIVQDISRSDEWLAEPSLPNTRSELALPLRVRGQIIGALSVQSASLNDFPPGLVSTLQTMSEQIAISLDNARLLAEAEARARRQQLLHQVSTRLHSSADVDTIVGIGLEALSQQLGGAHVALHLGRPRVASQEESVGEDDGR